MGLQPDQIKPGMWIVVTNQLPPKSPPPDISHGNIAQLIPVMQPVQPFHPNGVPMKITAISWPFIVGYNALNPTGISTIDITRFEVRKAERAYVNRFTDHYLQCVENRSRPNVE